MVGFPLGHVSVPARFKAAGFPSPRDAMERVVLGAVSRPPCVVGFSGGRDSSAVLAVAVHVARREGLPSPIPVTRVFADVPESDETEWQELVIRHLGITEWIREPIDDEMDVLGPLAQARLRRHGVLWSPLLHGDDYSLGHARGGSLLDGEGGDDVCDPAPHRSRRWRTWCVSGSAPPAVVSGGPSGSSLPLGCSGATARRSATRCSAHGYVRRPTSCSPSGGCSTWSSSPSMRAGASSGAPTTSRRRLGPQPRLLRRTARRPDPESAARPVGGRRPSGPSRTARLSQPDGRTSDIQR